MNRSEVEEPINNQEPNLRQPGHGDLLAVYVASQNFERAELIEIRIGQVISIKRRNISRIDQAYLTVEVDLAGR